MASIKKRPDGSWRARYRDESGKEHAKHFNTKAEGQRWLDQVTTALVSGTWIDPREGHISFKEFAEDWRSNQVHRESTASQVKTNMNRHVYPVIGHMHVGAIRHSHIQALVKGMTADLSPRTVELVYRYVANVFATAVNDRVIKFTPCTGIKLPKAGKNRITPPETKAVKKLIATAPPRYQALVMLGAGTGLRSGEARGLTVDRVDFLRDTVRVDRQLIQPLGGGTAFGPPKTEASERTVPLPNVVKQALAAHLARFKANEDGLIFTTDDGKPIARNRFSEIWRPIVKAAKLSGDVGFHDLRHYYASLLIHSGESVKVVQDRLGHKTANETLDTYGHLWPNSEGTTRAAVDNILGDDTNDETNTTETDDGGVPPDLTGEL